MGFDGRGTQMVTIQKYSSHRLTFIDTFIESKKNRNF